LCFISKANKYSIFHERLAWFSTSFFLFGSSFLRLKKTHLSSILLLPRHLQNFVIKLENLKFYDKPRKWIPFKTATTANNFQETNLKTTNKNYKIVESDKQISWVTFFSEKYWLGENEYLTHNKTFMTHSDGNKVE
jgi:hypothetical protein